MGNGRRGHSLAEEGVDAVNFDQAKGIGVLDPAVRGRG